MPYLAGGNNYAFGGASIVTSNYPVPNLTTQLGAYAAGHAVDPNALYILNLGANDVFAIDSGTVPAAAVPAYDTLAANTLAGAVEYLAAHGATKILVTGVPVGDAAGLALDAKVEATLNAIAPTLTGTTLDRFSYLNFFGALTADPARFNVPAFTHPASDGCFSHLSPPATADCSGYFSVDGTHPIAPIQAALYHAVAHEVGIGAVPEPAAWSLMIAGFGLVGAAVPPPPIGGADIIRQSRGCGVTPIVLIAAAAAMTLPGGTVATDTKLGKGPAAAAGQTVTVNYTGWLDAGGGKHGKQFDSSVGKAPFVFPLGGGQVIPGWDAGVVGMKVGGKRTLIIPAAQGYGERGAGGDIPPGATLVFDIELLGIE